MAAEGLQSLFPMSELSIMGIAEVLPKIAGLLRRISETASAVRRLKPDAVVTIDAPAFCIRVLKRLGSLGIPKIHYVAPTVWAWRPWRAKKFAAVVDRLMVLLPFEPPWFERAGLAATFVGHPILESRAAAGDGDRFRSTHGIGRDTPVLCVLPGSRRGEVRRLLAPFADAVVRIRGEFPDLHVVIPTVSGVADEVRAGTAGWGAGVTIVEGDREKYDAVAAAGAALAASGTVALELAMSGAPTVIGYRVHPVTAVILRRMVTVRNFSLVNILLDREIIPEFFQEECRGDRLSDAVSRLLRDPSAAAEQRRAMEEAIAMLSPPQGLPSDAAADVVLSVVHRTTEDNG